MKCRLILFIVISLTLSACMKWDYGKVAEVFDAPAGGLFICNEGNFQYSNATLSYYDPATSTVLNEVFVRANGMKLGDVAQSMAVYGGRGWVVVNNSRVIFAIDLHTFRETGRITGFTSPRYIHFVSDTKAYVTQLWDNRIFIVNPQSYEVTGYITVPGMEAGSGSTEQMVQSGRYVYCNCWSYQNCIIRIDTATDRVDARLTVGIQPNSLVLDRYGKLWTICDGGYEGSPYGHEAPALFRIDAATFSIEREYRLDTGARPSELQISGDGSHIYWLDDDVWRMDVTADILPDSPVIPSRGTRYFGLTVSPADGQIYVADAIDYQQPGIIYRYSPDGLLLDSFTAGITPGAFCWNITENSPRP